VVRLRAETRVAEKKSLVGKIVTIKTGEIAGRGLPVSVRITSFAMLAPICCFRARLTNARARQVVDPDKLAAKLGFRGSDFRR